MTLAPKAQNRWCGLGFLGLVVALWIAGCAIGPDYRRPPVNTPANFRGAPTLSTNSLAELPWWQMFRDETLEQLIRVALTNNYDVGIAATRVVQARAVLQQNRAGFFPQLNYDALISRGKNSLPSEAFFNQGQTVNLIEGFGNVSWEIDLWGRIRRLNESARAQLLATEETRRGVTISLISDLAQAYFQLLALDDLLVTAHNASNSFEGSLEVFSQRLKGGVASNLETSRAEAALASAAATIPDLERQIMLQENQINILLGQNPGSVPRHHTLGDQVLPVEIPVGLPSALLERRPDIRQAEQLLRSANAQIGVAEANFFPQISLTALLGKVNPELSAITSGTSTAWNIAANATGPIFQGGLLVGQYRQAKAARDEARLRYQATILYAFQEVSGALIAHDKLVQVQFQQARSVRAYQEAVQVSTQRYLVGNASYFEILEAQQQLFPAENSLIQTELNERLAIVQLYRALGGGWK